ncbi:MAG: dTDP-4-dehydrorhamnose 3,5-epimerase family protein, partial [Deltaproteobacteria bacterium]|nr:dTDP-4-dehydrorhamnose 3,5-epimerase family protein [Deltaproteobacteria bacterium]
RGMHYQVGPSAEDKLVSCLAGKIFDVAIDIRPKSPSYRRWFGVELSSESHGALYVPKGFAHGFITLADNTLVHYQISNYFDQNLQRGLCWDDPAIGIRWPIEPHVISERDLGHPLL